MSRLSGLDELVKSVARTPIRREYGMRHGVPGRAEGAYAVMQGESWERTQSVQDFGNATGWIQPAPALE